ncbi:MAG TPA: FtsX-like permease family protein [Candidatus Bipolaricaulota bacterium]
MFFKIALRNVFRNKRRTLLSLGIVALGVSILSLVIGFVSESLRATKAELAREIGSFQIGSALMFDDKAEGFEYLIPPQTLDQLSAILNAQPQVSAYTYQINFGGIIGTQRSSTALVARGLVPGNPIEDYSSLIESGEPLNQDDTPQILIGRQLAQTLDVKPGDWINLATGTVSGAFKAASAQVLGTFRYNNSQLEDQLGLLPLWFAQKVLRTDGVERVIVQLKDLDQAQAVGAQVEQALAQAGIGLEVRGWQELTTFYASIEQFWNVFSGFTVMGVFVLAFFSVLEVLTMSFLERAREVGTIRAVGTRRHQVFWTFLLEGALLGALGGALGLALGAALAFAINALGVGWQPPGAIDPVPLQIAVGADSLTLPFITAVVSTLLGTLYPALKNARLNIVKALNYV